MFYSIDRITEDIAVCIADNGEIINVDPELINGDFKEGSILFENTDGCFTVDEDETAKRKKANFDLAESLFGN